jgi:hypothetical protein
MAPVFLLKTSKQNSRALFGLMILYFLIESPTVDKGAIIFSLPRVLGVNAEIIIKRKTIRKGKITFDFFLRGYL